MACCFCFYEIKNTNIHLDLNHTHIHTHTYVHIYSIAHTHTYIKYKTHFIRFVCHSQIIGIINRLSMLAIDNCIIFCGMSRSPFHTKTHTRTITQTISEKHKNCICISYTKTPLKINHHQFRFVTHSGIINVHRYESNLMSDAENYILFMFVCKEIPVSATESIIHLKFGSLVCFTPSKLLGHCWEQTTERP